MPSDPTYENAAQQPGIPENTQVNDNIYKEFDNPLYSQIVDIAIGTHINYLYYCTCNKNLIVVLQH